MNINWKSILPVGMVLALALAAQGADVSFAENFDDGLYLEIGGAVWLHDTSFDTMTHATGALPEGWCDFEVRFGQDMGGVGPMGTWPCLGWDPLGRDSSFPVDYVMPHDGMFRVSAGVPGLWAGRLTGSFNIVDPNPNTSIEPGLGAMDYSGSSFDSGGLWLDNSTWVYTGQMYIPEPATMSLLGLGACLSVLRGRRRNRK